MHNGNLPVLGNGVSMLHSQGATAGAPTLKQKGAAAAAASAAAAAALAAASSSGVLPTGAPKADKLKGKDLAQTRPDGRHVYAPSGHTFCLEYQMGTCRENCPQKLTHGCELCKRRHTTTSCPTASKEVKERVANSHVARC